MMAMGDTHVRGPSATHRTPPFREVYVLITTPPPKCSFSSASRGMRSQTPSELSSSSSSAGTKRSAPRKASSRSQKRRITGGSSVPSSSPERLKPGRPLKVTRYPDSEISTFTDSESESESESESGDHHQLDPSRLSLSPESQSFAQRRCAVVRPGSSPLKLKITLVPREFHSKTDGVAPPELSAPPIAEVDSESYSSSSGSSDTNLVTPKSATADLPWVASRNEGKDYKGDDHILANSTGLDLPPGSADTSSYSFRLVPRQHPRSTSAGLEIEQISSPQSSSADYRDEIEVIESLITLAAEETQIVPETTEDTTSKDTAEGTFGLPVYIDSTPQGHIDADTQFSPPPSPTLSSCSSLDFVDIPFDPRDHPRPEVQLAYIALLDLRGAKLPPAVIVQ